MNNCWELLCSLQDRVLALVNHRGLLHDDAALYFPWVQLKFWLEYKDGRLEIKHENMQDLEQDNLQPPKQQSLFTHLTLLLSFGLFIISAVPFPTLLHCHARLIRKLGKI